MKKPRLPTWAAIAARAAVMWYEDNVFAHSAAVSFYTLFSLAPITIIVLSIAGFFFGEEVASRQFAAQVSSLMGKGSTEMIQQTVAEAKPQNSGWTSTVISVGVLVVGATTVFAQMQQALNEIWGVKSKPSRAGWLVFVMQRLVSFTMVVTIGFLLLVSLILTTALASFVHLLQGRINLPAGFLQFAELLVTLCVVTALFGLMFKIMPDVQVRWRTIWLGAFATALLFGGGPNQTELWPNYSGASPLGHDPIPATRTQIGAITRRDS